MMGRSAVAAVLLALMVSSQGRFLLQTATQQFPQFLLPPVPPQAAAQVQAVLSSIGGNVNSFANAVTAANQVGGQTAVARAFADTIAAGNGTALLNAIATATAFGRSDIANVLEAAWASAVADQIGRGNTNQAGNALAAAFTLAGGAGPALSTVRELANIVQSVGCTGPLADALRIGTTLINGANNSAFAGRGQTYAYTIAQQPGVAGCWTTVGGDIAGGLLSSIQPVIVVGQSPTSETAAGAAPVGAVAPQTSTLPPPGTPTGQTTTPGAAAGAAGNTAAPSTNAPVAGPVSPTQTGQAGGALVPPGANVAPSLEGNVLQGNATSAVPTGGTNATNPTPSG
jgi:hypothetical protein